MINKIVINSSKTEAVLYIGNRNFLLSSSSGAVLDLIYSILLPIESDINNYNSYINTFGETVIISIKE